MSDEQDKQLDEEMRQLMELEAKGKAQAETATTPEPQPESLPPALVEAPAQTPEPASEPVTPTPAPVNTPNPDDPMEWAKKKGLNSPESIARSLQQMEREFHTRNQQGHPGYQDLTTGNPAPPPPVPPQSWQPRPEMGYAPPPAYVPPRPAITQDLARQYGMDASDVERLMPLVMDAAEVVASRRTSAVERELAALQRQSARSNELMQLAQDPAFSDPRVQKEMHDVLKDGSIFQRERMPYATAFQVAMTNLARKQLQQGAVPETINRPPVTAGGGNGSANTAPFKITDELVASWTMDQQEAFFRSNGRIIPKR